MSDEITLVMLEQIKEIEQRDESQILAELAGETIKEYIYEIEVRDTKTKQKTRKAKLSWAGVKEVARSRGNIVLSDPIISDTDDAVRIVVRATDLKRNFTVFGGCHQPKQQKVKDLDKGGNLLGHHLESDDHYFPKALSKAQRNALNLCIPGDYAAKFISRLLKASGSTAALPPSEENHGNNKKPQIKPREEWETITADDVPNLPTLERIVWNLTKLQPRQMYQELGYTGRADVTESAWECFLRLKERFVLEPIVAEA